MQQGSAVDEWMAGWDETPGIVSVYADRRGRALVWRRVGQRTVREAAQFRPWLFVRDDAALATLRDHAPSGVTVQRLAAGHEAFNYLLSAAAGCDLRRIVQSALQQSGARWDDTAYLQLGPVEQYLMQSGRVYFRGLHFHDLRRLQFDLETSDLDPQRGRILLIALHDSSGWETVLEAPQPDDEAPMLRAFCALIAERDPDVIENHNLFGFDLPFLRERAALLHVPLLLGRRGAPAALEELADGSSRPRFHYSVAGREMLDTLDAVRRADFGERRLNGYGLKHVARVFGIAAADRVVLDGAAIAAHYAADPQLVRRYALEDVREVCRLSELVHQAAFAIAGLAPRRFERLAWAGPAMGILEPMLLRAYLRSGTAPPLPPQQRGERGGDHRGGATELFASGVARNVLKADIASLYPSLMVAEQIGPRCDSLNALTAIVARLRSARLEHKAAARDDQLSADERRRHAALSAAMKLIINSAYGYMGATGMALFADSAAADRVTARGRAVLAQLVSALQRRGLRLLEADTDGVFAAMPINWTAADAAHVVRLAGRDLPAGIQLELEGCYAAMYSHQMKNYALLGADGSLTLRGVAFRSRRSEPFAEHFFQQALPLLMRGEIAALAGLIGTTAQRLQQREFTARDMAVTARLRKTPAEYAAAAQRDGGYEALLRAGRSDWQPGERIRYYLAADGRTTLLTDQPLPYHADHYERLFRETVLNRLRLAFAEQDFAQLTRSAGQLGLFDRPLSDLQPHWIIVPAAVPPADREDSVARTDHI